MQLDPKIALWLNIAYQVLTSITAPTLQAFGVADATKVIAIAEAIAGALNIVLHAYSSTLPGPLAPKDPVK